MRLLVGLLTGLLVATSAEAQERLYQQGELDAMLAPIALQPDGVVSQVLIASTYPDEVAAAAAWARANPHMRGDEAVRAVQNEPWDPAVKSLLAFPELLLRMADSPQWLNDLGQAFQSQQAQVMDTVQGLRRRAQATGHLSSNDQNAVYANGDTIVVEPRTQIVYVPYYDPYVVYGAWWWPYYRPVFWRPWAPRPVFLTHGFFYARPVWHRHFVQVVHRPVHVHPHQQQVVPGKWQHRNQVVAQQHFRVPESQRRPIVQPQHNVPMPAASGFTQHRQQPRAQNEPRTQPRGEPRGQPRVEARGQPRAEARPMPRAEARSMPRTEARSMPRGEARGAPQFQPGAQQPRWHRS
jgi:hypothetical protein